MWGVRRALAARIRVHVPLNFFFCFPDRAFVSSGDIVLFFLKKLEKRVGVRRILDFNHTFFKMLSMLGAFFSIAIGCAAGR